MKRSDQRIITTHVGSLPRPDGLMALYRENASDEGLQPQLRSAVSDIVRRQSANGIDVVNDGEFGKAMRSAMDFGAWWSYVYPRLAGYELREEQAKKGRAAWTFGSKERKEFAEFYAAEASWPHRGKRSTQAAGPAASPAEFFVMRGNHEPANICLG